MGEKTLSLSLDQAVQKKQLEGDVLADMVSTERSRNAETEIESSRARSKLRRLGHQREVEAEELEEQIKHLEWTLENSNQERTKLEVEVSLAEKNLEADAERYAQQLQHKRDEFMEQESLLRSELLMYQTELESLKEFQLQRSQMEEDLRHLEQTLVKQRQVHQETMEQFRQQLSREKDQYEKENARRVKEAEKAAVYLKDEALEATAIRCIQDSEQINHQLRQNQQKSSEVLNTNTSIVKKIQDLRMTNQLISDREKMLISGVAKVKQQIAETKQSISEEEVSFAKHRAEVEINSMMQIEKLEQEIINIEKDNASLHRQLDFYTKRIKDIESQQKLTTTDQSRLIHLITSTAPIVLESLKSQNTDEDAPPPLQALISKLTEAVEGVPSAESSPREPLVHLDPTLPENKYF